MMNPFKNIFIYNLSILNSYMCESKHSITARYYWWKSKILGVFLRISRIILRRLIKPILWYMLASHQKVIFNSVGVLIEVIEIQTPSKQQGVSYLSYKRNKRKVYTKRKIVPYIAVWTVYKSQIVYFDILISGSYYCYKDRGVKMVIKPVSISFTRETTPGGLEINIIDESRLRYSFW